MTEAGFVRGVVCAEGVPESMELPVGAWSKRDKGAEASVAKEPEPGRAVRHRSRGRCGTDVPNSHNVARHLYEEGPVVNVDAAGMLGVGPWVAFPSLYRLLEEGPGEIGDSLR